MLLNICTPTYNRASLLKRLYVSLINQSNKNFLWTIIDDGSTDNTREIVSDLINDKIINIEYIYKPNGGKHTALNVAIDISDCEYFAIVDSDDYLLFDTVQKIYDGFETISLNKEKFAGISFNRGYSESQIIGETFKGIYIDATSIERKKYNILGDKFEVFYTSILKKHKFPVFDNEKFMPEIVVWTRIAAKGLKIRWFNQIQYICEYLEGGLTDNNDSLVRSNPKGYALRIMEQVTLAKISLFEKLGYYSFYYECRKDKETIIRIAKEINTNFFMLIVSILARKIYRMASIWLQKK